jgi:hypothetical protein
MKNLQSEALNFGEAGRSFSHVSRFAFHLSIPLLLVLALASRAAPASTKRDFSGFQDIVVSNIFNAKRSPSYVPGDQPDTRRDPLVDVLALTGTLIDEQGARAFFYGNRSEYQKVVKPEQKIAEFKVSAVDYGSVTLKSETNETKVPVGMQLSRKEGGTWHLGPRTDIGDSGSPAFASTSRNEERDRGDRRGDYRRSDRGSDRRYSFGRRDNGSSSDTSAFPNGGTAQDLIRTDPALSGAGANNGTASPAPSGRAETPEETLQRLARQREEQDKKP